MDDKKVPVIKLRGDGGFSVAVFADNKKRDDGTEYISYSAILQKSWKDKNGQWQQQSVSMFDNNVAGTATLLLKTASALLDLRNNVAQQKPATTTITPTATTNAQAIDELADSIPF